MAGLLRRPAFASAFRLIQQSRLPLSSSPAGGSGLHPADSIFSQSAASLWPASRSLATTKAAAPDAIGAVKPKKEKQASSAKRQTGYSVFSKDNYARIQGENKGLTFGELSSKVSAAWKSLSDSEKDKYKSKAEQSNQAAGVVKKEKPKSDRPTSPYIKFFTEQHSNTKASLPAGTSAVDITREIAKRWGQLSDEEKAKYKAAK